MISGKNFQITTVVLFVFVAFLLIGCSSKSGKVKETQEQTQEHAQEQTQGQNRASNAVSLEDLLNNKEKFNGQKVVVTGRVTKVNKMIMDRNWIHIADDANRDFTITTNDEVEIVDFGASGIIRCKRCRSYINPYVTWADNGRRWR